MKMILPSKNETFDIELSENLLQTNGQLARKNRERLDKNRIWAVDILGSVGSGKTTIAQQLVQRLRGSYRIAVIAGDLATTIDAERIRSAGAEVIQINTGGGCHLDAFIVGKVLDRLDLERLDLLIIENVGNLICPAEFPVGAHKRMVVVSTTEGPYMVVKHPFILMDASLLVVNKIDLAEAMQVDPESLKRDALSIKPGLSVSFTNALTGDGIDALIQALNPPRV